MKFKSLHLYNNAVFALTLAFTLSLLAMISPAISEAIPNNGASIISLANDGSLPNNISTNVKITPDASSALFLSAASNLTSDTVNGDYTQVFQRNMNSGATQLISKSTSGIPGDAQSSNPVYSQNGRYALFTSTADNLVANSPTGGDGSGYCYLRDIQNQTTTLVNPFPNASVPDSTCDAISNDGNTIVIEVSELGIGSTLPGGYTCDTSHTPCQWENSSYIYTVSTGAVIPVAIDSQGNGGSVNASNNSWYSYHSTSVSMSADGKEIAFDSNSTLEPSDTPANRVFVRNLATGSLIEILPTNYRQSLAPQISANGNYVTYYAVDSSGNSHVFVRNIANAADQQIDLTPSGGQPNSYSDSPSISSDGKYVAFRSRATNLTAAGSSADLHIFVKNLATNSLSQADINASGQQATQNIGQDIVSQAPDVTDAGGVAFWSYANNFNSAPAPQSYYTPPVTVAPTITSPASKTINARDPLNFTVTTTGTPTPTITETGDLPAGVTFTDNGDGTATFAGQASTSNKGYYFLTLTATNSAGSTTQNFQLTTTDYAEAPTFLNSSSITEAPGVPFSYTINTTGVPVPNITKSGKLPAGVSFKDNNDGTATISGTVASKNVGQYSLQLQAKNKSGTVTQSFTLNISN